MERAIIFVLGMHRSGTSLLSQILGHKIGGFPDKLIGANKDNPAGHWEPEEMVRINNLLLAHSNRFWADPKPLEKFWATNPKVVDLEETARTWLLQQMEKNPVIVLKDPRLSLVLPFWHNLLADLSRIAYHFVGCRHPYEVALSLNTRDNISIDHGLSLWNTYMLFAEKHTRGHKRALIHYDELISDTRRTLGSALRQADISVRSVDKVISDDMRSLVVPSLKRQSAREAVELNASQNSITSKLYKQLKRDGFNCSDRYFETTLNNWIGIYNEMDVGAGASQIVKEMPAWNEFKANYTLEHFGDLTTSIQYMELAILAAPKKVRYLHRLIDLYMSANELEKALNITARAIEIDPDADWVYIRQSQIYWQTKNFAAAELAAKLAVDLAPYRAKNWVHLGNIFLKSNKLSEALTSSDEALQIDQNFVSAFVLRSQVLAKRNELADAIKAARHAARLAPQRLDLSQHLFRLEKKHNCV